MSQIPKSQNPKITRSQNPKISKCQNPKFLNHYFSNHNFSNHKAWKPQNYKIMHKRKGFLMLISFAGSKAWKYHSLTLSVRIHKSAVSQITKSQMFLITCSQITKCSIPKYQNHKITNSWITSSQITKYSIPKSRYGFIKCSVSNHKITNS